METPPDIALERVVALILDRNERAIAEFEMLSLSFWQKLNEERAGILSDIARTGSVLSHG